MKDARATPLLLFLNIDAPATKILGLKPLAANVILLGAKQKAKTLRKRPLAL